MRLTAKQEAFAQFHEGKAEGNVTEAARLAGYANPGQAGHKLINNPKVLKRIGELREDVERLKQEQLQKIAIKGIGFLPDRLQIEGLAAAIAFGLRKRQVATITGEVIEVDFPPAQQLRALHLLAQLQGLLNSNTLEDGEDTGALVVPGETTAEVWLRLHRKDPDALAQVLGEPDEDVIDGEVVNEVK